uniref:Uncharacterized protein n=1 Tax=Lygus hesperus TaxID=30085 RepID=A0A0A9VQL9_LYGHE
MCDSSPPPPPNTFECLVEGTEKILEELEHLKKENAYLRSRIRYLESGRSKCKTSKWSKVKGAFGWEKEKYEGSSLTLKVPDRVPSDQSSSFSISPAGSYMSHSSLTTPPPPLSSSSSEEDIRLQGRRCTLTGECKRQTNNEDSRRSKSLDGDPVLPIAVQMPKASSSKTMMPKGNKTPWSKVKGIINTKAVRKRSAQEERWHRNSILHEGVDQEEHSMDEELCSGPIRLAAPRLTVTLPSNEELTAEVSTKKHRRLDSPNKLDQNVELSPGLSRKSKWFKVRNVFLQGSRSAPSSPVRSASFTYDLDPDEMSSGEILDDKEDVFHDEENLKYEIEASYLELQNKLEEEMSKKYCREVNLSPEFKKKLEEWDKMKLQGGSVTPKDWEHEKERKKREKLSRGPDKDHDSLEEEKSKKAHSREGSFKKHQTNQGARQEVLIPTSTGTFRFEGISDNFTKKLYEWEQARGIAPEESTFALLGPEYQPSFHHIDESGKITITGNGGLARSKSIGSIADLITGQSLVQQPSSLSLNDVDDLNHCTTTITSGVTRVAQGDIEIPDIIPREPLFCTSFAPEDVTRIVDSSSSNEELHSLDQAFRSEVVNSSYQLLQDNINLLDKLKNERDVCRQLENDMRTLEEQINSVSKSFPEDQTSNDMIEDPRGYDFEMDSHDYGNEHLSYMDTDSHCRHQSPLREYSVKLQDFTKVQTTLYDDEATQTTSDGLNYQICTDFNFPYENRPQHDVVLRIIGELQDLAERMKSATEGETTDGFHDAKNRLHYKDNGLSCSCELYGQNFSTYTSPSYWLGERRNRELSSLAEFISDKILELKHALNYMTTPSVSSIFEEFASPPPMSRVLHRTMAHDDLSPGENNPGDCRPASSASSSASTFSYLGSSSSRVHQDWSSPFSYHHNVSSYSCDQQPIVRLSDQHGFSGSYVDVTSDDEVSDPGLRINVPNVFVPTMRKIFSPVNDSEAVGVIIAEEDEPSETDGRDEEKDEETNEEIYEELDEENADEEQEEDTVADRFTASQESVQRDTTGGVTIFVVEAGDAVGAEEGKIIGNELISSVRLRAKSSSPAVERRTPKFSSVCFFFPVSENGVVVEDKDPPEVEELKLGEELTSSLKLRSLKIKRAKEEFLLGERNRQGSLSVVVDEDVLLQPKPAGLMVKFASEELVSESTEEKMSSKRDGMDHEDAEDVKDRSAVATLAWSSVSLMSGDTSTSHSCPTTPVLDKKTESTASSWIKNPARMIFRPKGKYMISDRQ